MAISQVISIGRRGNTLGYTQWLPGNTHKAIFWVIQAWHASPTPGVHWRDKAVFKITHIGRQGNNNVIHIGRRGNTPDNMHWQTKQYPR
jgi:hypothetical protein